MLFIFDSVLKRSPYEALAGVNLGQSWEYFEITKGVLLGLGYARFQEVAAAKGFPDERMGQPV